MPSKLGDWPRLPMRLIAERSIGTAREARGVAYFASI